MTIGIFVGSTYGNTEDAAEKIAQMLNDSTGVGIELINVKDESANLLLNYDKILIGCSTWHDGRLQDDWEDNFDTLAKLDLTGKEIALFGAGDQEGYANSFQDALGILGRELRARGAKIVGQWATDGYTFSESQGLDDNGKFFGLALDYDNQDKLTNPRIETWVQQVITEMKLT